MDTSPRTVSTASSVGLLATLAALLVGLVVDVGAAAETTAVAPPPAVATSLAPTITVTGGDEAARAEVGEAVARFAAAGLALPDLAITLHDDDAGCHGHLGWFRAGDAGWTIDLCSDLAFVPTHELAHAWIRAHVDDAQRDAVVALTGSAAWSGSDVAWDARGTEQAALAMQQVLMAGPGQRLTDRWAGFHGVWELLTGRDVPQPERWAA